MNARPGTTSSLHCPVCHEVVTSPPREKFPEYSLYCCVSCGAEFCDPLKAAPPEWYEEREYYAARWEFAEFLRDRPHNRGRLLEIGCGEGIFLEAARTAGYDVTGLDFNVAAVEVAREKGLPVHAMTLEEYRAGHPGRFDVIAFFQVLEHMEDPHRFLHNVHEALAPGGHLVFSVPNPQRWTVALNQREKWDYPPHHLLRFSRPAIELLLRGNGFRLLRMVDEPLRAIRQIHWLVFHRVVNWLSFGLSDRLGAQGAGKARGADYYPEAGASGGERERGGLVAALVKAKHAVVHAVVAPVGLGIYLANARRLHHCSGITLYVIAQLLS